MDAPFESISEESDVHVKAILAPFLFTYIYPFPDGSGRMPRSIMNALLAESGAPWTVIPVAHRDEYMNGLEEARQYENIVPLTNFVSELANAAPTGKSSE